MMDSDGSNYMKNHLEKSKDSKRLENSGFTFKPGEDYIFCVWQHNMDKSHIMLSLEIRKSEFSKLDER